MSERAERDRRSGGFSRRGFLGGAVGAVALTALDWSPAFRIAAASAAATIPAPPNFPAGISLYQQAFENWAKEIHVDGVWTCAPNTPIDVVTLANWAHANGYKLRPRGAMHGWVPFTIVPGSDISKVVLVDTTQHLTAVSIATSSPATVTAQAGATIEAMLTAAQAAGYGMVSVPAPGNITIGGALAIDAHGAALPANGETQIAGTTYGSLSNLVTSLTAVVWSPTQNAYVLKTFSRADADIKAFLTHLGRAFITSATLQLGTNYRLRCQSWYNIPTSELFAPQGSGGRTFASYVAAAGRVEAIWFPFTTNPWLKVWTPTKTKPFFSRQVTSPYNYSFSDNISVQVSDLLSKIVQGQASLTPSFGALQLSIVQTGLIATGTWDIWGWSKDLLFYIRPTTLRVSEGGAAILTNRANIQRVINEFTTWYSARLAAYQAQGRYPMNGPVEIRCCGLDQPGDVKVASSGSPQLSAVRPRPDHPEWDTAVWLDVLTVPGTPGAFEFYRDMEQFMIGNYTGSYGAYRPEWSKGWAFTSTAGWADATVLGTTIPNAYRAGQPVGDNWDTARATLNAYDPYRVFSNGFVDTLLP
ncbi:MAG TPA: cholesterol oxidase substrate-binding domain-containing protein [Acidimicrobiales bacterium]